MAKNSLVGAMMGGARIEDALVAGMNPQHLIVAGSGPRLEFAYQFIDASEGSESRQGRWAKGSSVDGKGQFSFSKIKALTEDEGRLGQVDPMAPAPDARISNTASDR